MLANPLIDGYTEQSTSGSDVYVSLYDMSNPSKPVLIGGYNPATEATATAIDQRPHGHGYRDHRQERRFGLLELESADGGADRRRLRNRLRPRDGDRHGGQMA